MRLILLTAIVPVGLIVIGCHHHHGSDHHGHEEQAKHTHHLTGHGHVDLPMIGITLWGDEFELFAEHPAVVVGKKTPFLLHITLLKDFKPLLNGPVTLELDGPESLVGKSLKPIRPGIYEISLTAKLAGKYSGRLTVGGEIEGRIEGVEVVVFDNNKSASKSIADAEEHDHISFLKEQQWKVPFETAFPAEGTLVKSIEVFGRFDVPPGGDAEVGAPITGRLLEPPNGFPKPGSKVAKNQVLAHLSPAPSSPEESARASLLVTETETRQAAARVALKRARRLIKDGAISQRELEEAQREAKVAEEALLAAHRTAGLYDGKLGEGGWKLTAPIGGVLTAVRAKPGAIVSPGTTLFRIVNLEEIWIRALVPEQDAARLRTDRNGSFQVAGQDEWLPINVQGSDATAAVVAVGRTVAPISRTVEVIYSLKEASPNFRVGGLVRLSLPAGSDFNGVVVSRDALLEQEGRDIVYVQVDGEHFVETGVTVGVRAGSKVGIKTGLGLNERVVVRGAHLIRLADGASSGQAHGHIH